MFVCVIHFSQNNERDIYRYWIETFRDVIWYQSMSLLPYLLCWCHYHACRVITITSDIMFMFKVNIKRKVDMRYAWTYLLEKRKISQEAPGHLIEHLMLCLPVRDIGADYIAVINKIRIILVRNLEEWIWVMQLTVLPIH